jgi:hypothetical protein
MVQSRYLLLAMQTGPRCLPKPSIPRGRDQSPKSDASQGGVDVAESIAPSAFAGVSKY